MQNESPLNVVFCWHMHQPEYRDHLTGEYHLPWTYLHAIKDYVDMVAHLENHPAARVVVNFAPILLNQIEDYAQQVQAYLSDGTALRDPLLAALDTAILPSEQEPRQALISACLRVNEQRFIHRFPPYQRLANLARLIQEEKNSIGYLSDHYLADLLVWYHLAWLGETVRRQDPRVQALIEKGSAYTLSDRHQLMQIIGELLSGVLNRYKVLAQRGQIELALSPQAHPIVPLLLDFNSAREAMPEVKLPILANYPDGETRARWHIEEGIKTFEHHFGFKPKGCWPSEGGTSQASLQLYADAGIKWLASGETVLSNSLQQSGWPRDEQHKNWLHQGYQDENSGTQLFFRDDGLSDLIGFHYANWHTEDAVGDLLNHLETIRSAAAHQPGSVVSIIMDGENAWEHFPENGFHFLDQLYAALEKHPTLKLTTFADLSRQQTHKPSPPLVAGSWVYGTFSTWIGDKDKNRGWDMLCDAKRSYDATLAAKSFSEEQLNALQHQLATCESSDWFWWFGDYNPEAAVSSFEQLFRLHLSNLYTLLGVEPPHYLAQRFAHGSGDPSLGGVMRPGQ